MAEPLIVRIKRHVAMSGPLPLAEYMHWAMADRTHGYYMSAEAIGRSGDFTTAPEISQMFGELVGAWAIQAWEVLGQPQSFNLVEIGPGHGTLMRDLLRTAALAPGFVEAASVHLIETSPPMIDRQRAALAGHANIHWHSSISELSGDPVILIANEFLDVLPIRQYVKTAKGWLERCVGLDDGDDLCWVLGSGRLEEAELPEAHRQEPEGSVYEVSLPRESYVRNLAAHIAETGGAALFFDYGHLETGFGDTLQALSKHQFADPLADPGKADLTSHVDFQALAAALGDTAVVCHPAITQGDFLLTLGLLERAGRLGAGKSADQQAALVADAERLALPDRMGDLFKVFCFSTRETMWPFDRQS